MSTKTVYLLLVHDPWESEEGFAVNVTVVEARTLLHPAIRQPDGGRLYRCLTEPAHREDGALVPLSTITFELAGGDLWHLVGDWEALSDDVVELARVGYCDSMTAAVSQTAAVLLTAGPETQVQLITENGATQIGPDARTAQIARLRTHLEQLVVGHPFWPGEDLIPQPAWSISELTR